MSNFGMTVHHSFIVINKEAETKKKVHRTGLGYYTGDAISRSIQRPKHEQATADAC